MIAIREDSLGAAGFDGSLLACAGLFAHVLFAFQSSLREFDNLEYSAADAPSNRVSDDNAEAGLARDRIARHWIERT